MAFWAKVGGAEPVHSEVAVPVDCRAQPRRHAFLDGVLCHEQRRSKRRCVTVLEMKVGPSGSAIRSLIPSRRKLLWPNTTVVSVTETPGQDPGRHGCERRARANRR